MGVWKGDAIMLRLSAVKHKKDGSFDEKVEHIFFLHPYFTLFFYGMVVPIMILVAVVFGTCIIALPLGLILGWL